MLLLPLRATPHTLEREPLSRLKEKLVGVRSIRDPKQMVPYHSRHKRAFGAHFYLLPTLLRIGGKRKRERESERETD